MILSDFTFLWVNPSRENNSTFYCISLCSYYSFAQMAAEKDSLIAQKDNIITANTILKIENLGIKVNSDLAELRPTISADGNLLFFICENHPANTKYNSVSQFPGYLVF